MSFTSNMANREVCDMIWVDFKTKKPFMNFDFANTNTTELTGETVYAYGGKGHPKRVGFDGEKGGTLTVETQMSNIKLFQLLTGGKKVASSKYYVREKLTIAEGKVTLSADPVAGTVVAFKPDDDCGDALESSGTGKEISITGVSSGDVVVYYMKETASTSEVIRITSTDFPKDYIVYGDTIMKTEDGDLLPYRVVYYKVHPQAQMSLAFSNTGDPGTITITADLLVDNDNNMLDIILEEEDSGEEG